ncbi:protein of unknown function [Vibrio tapetis subsp. tapetis]|uniref:Uncharacterized protein n=1 Tax=Vibrio tapetis subsp. tapetis TaxID=1671868 RepID=A0A2N8ZGL3_9VIBR|nr:protein of unknown function [Vibrio tapetis subsp. tapetis]
MFEYWTTLLSGMGKLCRLLRGGGFRGEGEEFAMLTKKLETMKRKS